MIYKHERQYKKDNYEQSWRSHIYQSFDSNSGLNWCDVTFSLKSIIFHKDGSWEKISRNEASKFNRELLKRLNKRVYGKAYRRYEKRLFCIPVIEENKMGRLHIHMFLSIPDYMQYDIDEFCVLVLDTARELRWCESGKYAQNLVRHHIGMQGVEGWIGYMLKDVNKNSDVLDLDNLHLPQIH